MTTKSATPSTATRTSMRDRPFLRFFMRAVWVVVVLYLAKVLEVGFSVYLSGWFTAANILQQITQLGFNLLTFTTIEFICDIYVLLGYFGLAVVLFMQRSDDWFAILLSIFVMTFGMSLTKVGNDLAGNLASQYWIAPIMAIGQSGIVLIGWLYPDGSFYPRWLKYALPVLLVSMAAISWPGLLVLERPLGLAIYLGTSFFWYFGTVVVMSSRYRNATNPNQKQQIRWVYMGMLGPLVWFILYTALGLTIPAFRDETSAASALFHIVMQVLSIPMFLALPASLTLALARLKLFDVDLIINRALVYSALTVVLVSIFAFVLVIDTALLNLFTSGKHTSIGLIISAVAAGALFQPTRKSLRRFVDRTFYRINIDYSKPPAGLRKGEFTGDTITQAPTLFSGYKNLVLIGKGGMAEVYRAEQTTHHRTVAIKVLLSNLAEDDQYRKRFEREAQTLAGLEHPNIVRLYDYGVENRLYYMVMEYLNGMNLSALLRQNTRLQLDEATPILNNVAEALDYAHGCGLVHRDVKPSNVIMDTSRAAPRSVLTDFGIAKQSAAFTNITASAVLGTFDYIAPEQIEAATDVDGRADIYSFGVMSYQMLTGQLPFRRSAPGAVLLAHMTAPPPDARDLLPELPRRTAKAIQTAMAKKPAERFSSAREFIQAMLN